MHVRSMVWKPQFKKFLIAPNTTTILRRADSFTANKHNLPRFTFGIFLKG